MAIDDVPLNDAGRDYYNRQFGDRVKNIRKAGAAPPTAPRKGGCLGVGGGSVFAIYIIIRLIAAVASSGSSSYNSNYNNYNYTPPNITIPDPPPPVDWRNNIPVDPPPVDLNPPPDQPDPPIIVPPNPPLFPPDDPLLRPDPPAPPAPPAPAPAVPDDDKPADGDK